MSGSELNGTTVGEPEGPSVTRSRRSLRLVTTAAALAVMLATGCSSDDPDPPVLGARLPLHLEDHLDLAKVEGSEVPEAIRGTVSWDFEQPQPGWTSAKPLRTGWEAGELVRDDAALRLPLTQAHRSPRDSLVGVLHVALPDWQFEDWAYVEVRARTSDSFRAIGLAFNYDEEDPFPAEGGATLPFFSNGDRTPVVTDGTTQTYRLTLHSPRVREWDGPWTHLALWFATSEGAESATIDLFSVRVVPTEADYAAQGVGVKSVRRAASEGPVREAPTRRSLYLHAPGEVRYRVRVPEGGRLDVGLGVLRDDAPVNFRITTRDQGGAVETLLEEVWGDPESWAQRSVSLAALAGDTVTLTLEAHASTAGTVALWSAPTLTGSVTTEKPNVIFYVIDGGAADAMGLYGSARNTTPNIDEIAAEGAVFETAFSNSSWTKPSTRSFMTSLHDSVLGSTSYRFDPLPEDARTLAQRFHEARYQTGVFISNPWAGSASGLQRGVDWLWEEGSEPTSVSTVGLHREFWDWRSAYPGGPYWVHFQTTDVHKPFTPVDPFAHSYVRSDRFVEHEQDRVRLNPMGWWEQPSPDGPRWLWSDVFERTGIDRVAWYTTERSIYDEVLAHQDHQLGQFVKQLKASGEWENTILVIASDHAFRAGAGSDFGLATQGDLPEQWSEWGPLMRTTITHVPLIFSWPGHIRPGQRFPQAVSMIDVAPTLLDLAGLPAPDGLQGRSLAPLLLGQGSIEARPVIIEEGEWENDEYRGVLEVVDGRWGASLAINGGFSNPDNSEDQRPSPLLVYDLSKDPLCFHPINDERADLVERYRTLLEARWQAHQTLAERFTKSQGEALTPDQLRTLQALGYVGEE